MKPDWIDTSEQPGGPTAPVAKYGYKAHTMQERSGDGAVTAPVGKYPAKAQDAVPSSEQSGVSAPVSRVANDGDKIQPSVYKARKLG